MLRITTVEIPQALTLRLEGRLEGPWVSVLAECWSGALPMLNGRELRIDLNGVIFIDAQGKARLAEMYTQGAQLLGENVESKAIVAEIRTTRAGAADRESRQVIRPKAVVSVSDELTELQRLQGELHEVNEEFAKAAHPLDQLSEMNEEQRQKVADELRARLARWESVTQQIAEVMGTGSANRQGTPTGNEGESR